MYCFKCGTKLKEAGLGGLYCPSEECKSEFIPFIDKDGCQNLMEVGSE